VSLGLILKRPLLASALLAALVVLAVAGASGIGLLETAELEAYDLLVRSQPAPPPAQSVAIVDFDDETFDRLRVFPAPRAILAEVIEKIASGRPELIGLDVLLSEKRPGEAEGERRLAAAVADAGNVILADNFGGPQLAPSEPLPEYKQNALDVGFVNLALDRDGFVRRMYLGLRTIEYTGLSFPVALVTNYVQKPLEPGRRGGFRIGFTEIPLDGSGQPACLIGYWTPRPAEVVSAARLLDDSFDAGRFHGRIVIVGQGSSKAQDRFMTPLFRSSGAETGRLVPGPEIHAAAVATLLTGRIVRPLDPRILWAANLALAFAVIAAAIRSRPARGVLLVVLAALGAFAVAEYAFASERMWIRFVSSEAVAVLALPAVLGFRFLEERRLKAEAEADREQLMGLFGRYVSSDVAAEIWRRRNEIELAGEERTATVLFSDIRNFTGLTAGKGSSEVLTWLNDYFTEMSDVVKRNQGFLNKFIGDGLMVVFGVPLGKSVHEDACRAVRTAIEMLERVQDLNKERPPGRPELRIGIGIHTGPLTAGTVGSRDRLEYSVIGETVNLASRLEGLCKELKTCIVLSPTTEELVRDDFETAPLAEAQVRGFDGRIEVYTLRTQAPAAVDSVEGKVTG
jgi:CHASE2 domain-containing sensor protein/class 3 adenylate cyclase